MKKLFVIAVLSSLLISCSSNQKLSGTYIYDEFYGVYSELTLNNDSSYKLTSVAGLLLPDTAEGGWEFRGNHIYLTRYDTVPETLLTARVALIDTTIKVIEVLSMEDGLPIPLLYVKVNDSLLYQTNKEGMVYIDRVGIINKISFFYHSTAMYYNVTEPGNLFIFEIKSPYPKKTFIPHQMNFLIRHKKLVLENEGFKMNYYKKNE